MPKVEPCLRCDSELELDDSNGYYLCNDCGYCIDGDSDSIKFHNSIYARIRKEVQHTEQLIGNRDHPENYCHRCGGKNLLNWTADNDVWNAVMRKDGLDLFDGIVCPICFVQLAEKTCGRLWRLVLEGDDPEIDKLRVQLHKSISKEADLLQRTEQLELFEKLAVPIVKWTQEYHKDKFVRTGYAPNKQKLDECTACLAASPATEPLPTFEDVRGIFKKGDDDGIK